MNQAEDLRYAVSPNEMMMEHDETTPPCKACGVEHVGTYTACYLLLHGSYGFSEPHGCEMFFLAPNVKLQMFEAPNGQVALVVDVREQSEATMILHEECVEMACDRVVALEHWDRDDEDEERNFDLLSY